MVRCHPSSPADEPADHYSSDPERPVPFITEPTFAQIGGPDDYRPVERRDDVLVYTTEPLAEDTEVTGPIRASSSPHRCTETPTSPPS